jgi:hypothetical protein
MASLPAKMGRRGFIRLSSDFFSRGVFADFYISIQLENVQIMKCILAETENYI